MAKPKILSKLSDLFQQFSEVEKGNCIFTRTEKTADFTRINNELINNESLSAIARFVMIYILSKPDWWIINEADICKKCGIGAKQFRNVFSELEAAGYVKRFQFIDPETGQFTPNYYLINENPNPEEYNKNEDPDREYPQRITVQGKTLEGRTPEGGTLLTTDQSTTDLSKTNKTNNITGLQKIKGGFEAIKKNVDVFFKKEKVLSKEQLEMESVLLAVPGMDSNCARNAVENYSLGFILQKIKELQFRDCPESQGKTLYNSIKGNWPAPAGYQKQEQNRQSQEQKAKESETWLPVVQIWDQNFYNQCAYGRGESFVDEVSAKRIITQELKKLWKKTDTDYCYTIELAEKINKTRGLMSIYDAVNMQPGELEAILLVADELEVF